MILTTWAEPKDIFLYRALEQIWKFLSEFAMYETQAGTRDGQRYSKMYRLKRYRYAIFEKKIV